MANEADSLSLRPLRCRGHLPRLGRHLARPENRPPSGRRLTTPRDWWRTPPVAREHRGLERSAQVSGLTGGGGGPGGPADRRAGGRRPRADPRAGRPAPPDPYLPAPGRGGRPAAEDAPRRPPGRPRTAAAGNRRVTGPASTAQTASERPPGSRGPLLSLRAVSLVLGSAAGSAPHGRPHEDDEAVIHPCGQADGCSEFLER
jgi:hypothetical protein